MKLLQGVIAAALFGVASFAIAQTAPTLTVSVSSPTTVAAGTALRVASVTLTSTSAVTLSQLPLSVGFSDPMSLTNCALQDSSGAPLTQAQALSGSTQVVETFTSPLTINGTSLFSLVCDIPAATPSGSAVAVSIFPSKVSASSTLGVVSIVSPSTVDGGTTGGVAGITSNTLVAVNSGTSGTNTSSDTPPGTPNTGAGGDAGMTFVILAAALLLVVGSSVYLAKRYS